MCCLNTLVNKIYVKTFYIKTEFYLEKHLQLSDIFLTVVLLRGYVHINVSLLNCWIFSGKSDITESNNNK